MAETRKLSLVDTRYCPQYKTEAKIFIQDKHQSGLRHLVVQYEKGGYEGRPEFTTGIPANWTEQDISNFLLQASKNLETKYPLWEISSRMYGSLTLFRWWAGEEPS